EA
ncbi:unnamed protein product, partial [Fusarium langsethiae]